MITGESSLLRTLIIYSVCLPLAIFLGYMMATPQDYSTLFCVGLVLFLLTFPLLLRWHHALLIVSINMLAIVPFLPGHPYLWIASAWLSLGIGIARYILDRRLAFISVPSVTKPLIFLAVVVLVTMKLTGGFGLGALGSDTLGGKRYIIVLSSMLAFFALTSQRIPPHRATLYVVLYFLAGATSAIGEIAPLLPAGAYIIFALFPVSDFGYQAVVHGASVGSARLGGLSMACSAALWALLARYGVGQLADLRRTGRAILFVCLIVVSMLGGFRSSLMYIVLVLGILFYLEGLMRTRLLPVAILAVIFAGAILALFSNQLPLSIQRTISFLPVPVDPLIKQGAQGSTDWRLQIWQDVIPDIPKYFFLGKGYGYTSKESQAVTLDRFGDSAMAGAELAGDYHNGPLSVILPFGIFGVIGFIWFLAAGWKVLYRNYQYGHPYYARLNRFLYAFYVAKIINFVAIFGALNSDFIYFTGLVGLSVSLNGGVARKLIPVAEPKRSEPQKLRHRPVPAMAASRTSAV